MEPNNGPNFAQFVKDSMFQDYVHFVDEVNPKPGEDWRNLAINNALIHSYNAEWIWFTEQDFVIKDGFWDNVEKHESDGCEVIAVYQESRMHPCCIFIKRSSLNRTRKNFGIVPNKSDHFSMIQEDIETLGIKVGKIDKSTYKHYNGLSQNWYLSYTTLDPNYQIDEFVDWLKQCLKTEVKRSDKFDKIANAVIIAKGKR